MHTALTTYRALIDAAESAPTDREWAKSEGDGYVRIPTSATGSMRLKRTRERLEYMAETVRKNWAMFGGGPKPAELKPARRITAGWKPALVQVWREQLELGDAAGACRLGLEKLGGRFYLGRDGVPLAFIAPKPVEGLPECFASMRRDDGKYLVMDLVSGASLGRGELTRAAAEKHAAPMWIRVAEDVRARRLSAVRAEVDQCQDTAMRAWCERYGVDLSDMPQAPADYRAPESVPDPLPAPEPVAMAPEPIQEPEQTPEDTESATLPDPAPAAAESTDAAPMPCDATSPSPAHAAGPGGASSGPEDAPAPPPSGPAAVPDPGATARPRAPGARPAPWPGAPARPMRGHPRSGIFGAATPVTEFLGPARMLSCVTRGPVSRLRAGIRSTGPPRRFTPGAITFQLWRIP